MDQILNHIHLQCLTATEKLTKQNETGVLDSSITVSFYFEFNMTDIRKDEYSVTVQSVKKNRCQVKRILSNIVSECGELKNTNANRFGV